MTAPDKKAVPPAMTGKKSAASLSAERSAQGTGEPRRSSVASARDNPLQLLVAAAAFGFALGAILPRSQREVNALAPIVEQMIGRAADKGHEVIERSKQAARQAAVDRVVDEAVEVAGVLADSFTAKTKS